MGTAANTTQGSAKTDAFPGAYLGQRHVQYLISLCFHGDYRQYGRTTKVLPTQQNVGSVAIDAFGHVFLCAHKDTHTHTHTHTGM